MIALVVQGKNIKTAAVGDNNLKGWAINSCAPLFKYNERGVIIDSTNGRNNK